ncbi:MAG: hypothetical protein E7325_01540 [Clostridiales bacterium]|nr:hypothetical protein [Clostridiales bacterium]
MKMTSAAAAKELKKLNEQHEALTAMENKSSEFIAAIQEDIETVRPAYDYVAVQKELAEVEQKIRALKHAINTFNLGQTVPGFDMTIDQMLVYIPQLSARKRKLEQMKDKLPRERVRGGSFSNSGIIEYTYVNYDLKAVSRDYDKVTDELSRAQNALDLVNSTVEFEV